MSDAELIQLSKRYKARKARADDEKEKADKLKARIVKELERRGTKTVVHGGVQVTRVARTHTEYDYDQLAERLPASTMRKIQVRRVDKDALGSLVQRGKVNVDDVDACARLVTDAAYPLVSLVKDK